MLNRNINVAYLKADYLFPEIAKRRNDFAALHPEAKIISLGVGDTTEPIPSHITRGLVEGAKALSTLEGYSGYSDEGLLALRKRISTVLYGGMFGADEIFISDGAKCDIARLQLLFGKDTPVVVQNPTYPVYVDGSVLTGAAGPWVEEGYKGIFYLDCTKENKYFPDLSGIPHNALIYFCSPNNPTGAVATKGQLTKLVDSAFKTGSLIIFDASYAQYIRDRTLPKSIFEIEGSSECAIEVQSFSKSAGFTGVRLGWTVVPKKLKYESGFSINKDWSRVVGTIFNGASNIAQKGGLAALEPEGLAEMRELSDYYLGNAGIIKDTLHKAGIPSIGGINSPYIWAHFAGRNSWDVFTEILEHCHVVVTPGSGFGSAGESFIRFSAFGNGTAIQEACARLSAYYKGASL